LSLQFDFAAGQPTSINDSGRKKEIQKTIKKFSVVLFTLALLLSVVALPTRADEPGRGITAQFEINYLKFFADHHFAALRMTELAAGTDLTRDAEISPNEGNSPTPNEPMTPAKATINDIKSLARRTNRVQREEILEAQKYLREWYKIEYQPHSHTGSRTGDGRRRVQPLFSGNFQPPSLHGDDALARMSGFIRTQSQSPAAILSRHRQQSTQPN